MEKANTVRTFFIRGFLLLLLLVLTDQALGLLLEQVYFHLRRGQFAEATYAINSTHQDILVFGSSKAVRHYMPSVLTRGIPQASCYNVGKDAERMPYYAAIQETILKRYQPKLFILDVIPNELDTDPSKYLKLSALFPYAKQHPELLKYLAEIGPFEKYKIHSRTYPFNSDLFIMLADFLSPPPPSDHGFSSLTRALTPQQLADLKARKDQYDAHDKDPDGKEIDPKAVAYYRNFLAAANRAHIKTLVVISPTLLGEKAKVRKTLLETIARQYPNVVFADFSNDKRFVYQHQKFADMFHLNQAGAREFSEIFRASVANALGADEGNQMSGLEDKK